MNLDLSKIKKVFFIGIGGIGISALAKMAVSKGLEIGGVNDDPSPKTLDPLRELGAKILMKDELDGGQVPEADLYVYSDAWSHRGPEIIQSARDTGNPVVSYAEGLGIFSRGYEKVIAIAGTHGKTTTTSMVAEVMIDAGLDPTVVVGSITKKFGSNFREGKSNYLVVEADEYMRHFLNLHPWVTIITNVEADHLDVYKDLADVKSAFDSLISQTESTVICNPKDIDSHVLVHDYGGAYVDYTKYLDQVPKLRVPGVHNRMNAATVLALSEILGISTDAAGVSLMNFEGTWRRLEKKGVTESGVIVYDDYAHHPTEVRASLQGLRELYPGKRIVVLFQPHLYSRTKALFDDFALSFNDADDVFLLPIYFAREEPDPTISSQKLAQAIKNKGKEARAFDSFEEAEGFFANFPFEEGDIFVTMGAGEAYKVADAVFKLN